FTPSGIGIGSRPMRDISSPSPRRPPVDSPYLAGALAAHTRAPRLAVAQGRRRRGQDAAAEAAPHRRDLAVSDVDAQARAADPTDAGDHRAPSLVVAQPDAQDGEALR